MSLLEQIQRLGVKYQVKLPLLLMCELVDLIHRNRMEAWKNHEYRTMRDTQPKV